MRSLPAGGTEQWAWNMVPAARWGAQKQRELSEVDLGLAASHQHDATGDSPVCESTWKSLNGGKTFKFEETDILS